MSAGNPFSITMALSNTIELTDIFAPENWEDFDWKSAAYWWQFDDDAAKSSTFAYIVQPSETDLHDNLEREIMNAICEWFIFDEVKDDEYPV